VIGAAATLEGGRCDFGEPVAIQTSVPLTGENCRSGRVQRGLVPSPKNQIMLLQGRPRSVRRQGKACGASRASRWIAAL